MVSIWASGGWASGIVNRDKQLAVARREFEPWICHAVSWHGGGQCTFGDTCSLGRVYSVLLGRGYSVLHTCICITCCIIYGTRSQTSCIMYYTYYIILCIILYYVLPDPVRASEISRAPVIFIAACFLQTAKRDPSLIPQAPRALSSLCCKNGWHSASLCWARALNAGRHI